MEKILEHEISKRSLEEIWKSEREKKETKKKRETKELEVEIFDMSNSTSIILLNLLHL